MVPVATGAAVDDVKGTTAGTVAPLAIAGTVKAPLPCGGRAGGAE
jgi:hypothetical protein